MTLTRFMLCLTLVLLAGCSRSPRVMFYTLNATSVPGAPSVQPFADSVVIGPVTLPQRLDRPQLVVRSSANRVEILETHHWAEPLKNEIPRIVAEELNAILGSVRVAVYPQNAGLDAAYRITIDLQQFEMTTGEGVTLDALWSIRRSDGALVKSGRTLARETVKVGEYDTLVAAQSRTLAAISRDLAAALREATVAQGK